MRTSGFMIDMDGTVYKGTAKIEGADGMISLLRSKGIPFVFLTNNSSHSRRFYLEKLLGMGFDVTLDNVLTSTVATVRFILSERPGKKVYPIAVPEVVEEMEASGIRMSYDDPDIVLLAYDRTITFDKINAGYRFLMSGAELIATHPDDLCPTEDSYDVDIGAFIDLFKKLCGVDPVIVGKPNGLMLDMAAREMGVDPLGTVMVGDRLYTDMLMADRAGIASVLVLSGETSREDLERSDVKPSFVLDSVADIASILDRFGGGGSGGKDTRVFSKQALKFVKYVIPYIP